MPKATAIFDADDSRLGAALMRINHTMRTVWKGTITFGLVSIPVAVYPATREEKVAFKQLRKSDISPIRYKKVAEADDKEVPAEEVGTNSIGHGCRISH